MRRTRVVIQSRLNSSRLPGKAMLTVGGMPLIELVARRASRSGHEVVVATSVEDYDGLIAQHLESVGITVVRGSLDDVLGRFVVACEGLADDDFVVRLTGDNPVADADLVAELIESTVASGQGYGRVDMERVPEGLGAEVFTAGAMREAAAQAVESYDREHVTPWLIRTFGQHSFAPVDAPTDIHAYRATVDSLSDYVRVSRLFDGTEDAVSVPWRTLMDALGRDVESPGSARCHARMPRSAASPASSSVPAPSPPEALAGRARASGRPTCAPCSPEPSSSASAMSTWLPPTPAPPRRSSAPPNPR